MQVLLPGFTKAHIEVLLPFTTLPTFYKLPTVGFRNPVCGYTTYPMCECWSLYKVSFKILQKIIDMLENFDFFSQLLLHQLCGALKIYKKIVSASQLGTSEIRAEMCPATLTYSGMMSEHSNECPGVKNEQERDTCNHYTYVACWLIGRLVIN